MSEQPDVAAPIDAADAQPPADTPDTGARGEKDWKAEAEKWKALARQHEQRAKANAEKAKQFDEITEREKTELQRLTEAKTAAERRATETEAELAKLRAAVKFGLSEEDLELLDGVMGTPEEIMARAERLAKRLGAGKKAVDFGGGSRGSDVGKRQWTMADLEGKTAAEINQARKAGLLDQLMGKAR